jgi:DNA-binding MarR family transcriptional regulator
MAVSRSGQLIHDFLGSAHIFTSAVNDVVEKRLLRQVAGADLTFSQFRLLKLVEMTDARTIGDVALFLGVSNAAASKAVDKLVRQGLLGRSEGAPDRREIRLSLTSPAQRLLAAYAQLKDRKLARVFRQFAPEELQRAAQLLDRLSAGIVDHTAKADEVCLQCGIYFREKCLVRQMVNRNCFYHRHKSHKSHPPHPGNGAGQKIAVTAKS